MRCLVLALLAALLCCNPKPLPVGDGPSRDPCEAMCRNLKRLGCPEGGARCAPTCRRTVAAQLTHLPVECIAAAESVVQVSACGGVACDTP